LGIVWFHCKAPYAEVGYAGLPVFVAISVALTTGSKYSESPLVSIRKRARRLLGPWILCSLAYAIWRLFGNLRAGREIFATFDSSMLTAGAAIHLWYLPFIFLVTCITVFCRPSLRFGQFRFIAIGLAAAAIIVCSWGVSQRWLLQPFDSWLFCVPAIFIGLALPTTNDLEQRTRGVLILTACVSLACLISSSLGYTSTVIPYSLGTIALSIAWVAPFAASANLKRIAGMTFEVYLMHPMFLSLLMIVTGLQFGTVAAVVTWTATSSLVLLFKTTLPTTSWISEQFTQIRILPGRSLFLAKWDQHPLKARSTATASG
jgi:surface polysaccharide O-acyltransferase-like enzyme